MDGGKGAYANCWVNTIEFRYLPTPIGGMRERKLPMIDGRTDDRGIGTV